MKSWFLIPLLSASLLAPARADDLNARATQIKTQLQTQWLPAWATKSPANETALEAALALQTLSHAHILGYSTPQLNLLTAAQVHYKLLRDSRRDKTNDGFFATTQNFKDSSKSTLLQAQVVSSLVEYARASGEAEPRGLAIKTWRLIRDRAGDKINGGYYDFLVSAQPTPTSASASGLKSAATHLALLEAATKLFETTRDRSIKTDLLELLDLNQGRFFPARLEDSAFLFTPNWEPVLASQQPPYTPSPDIWSEAAAAIARAQKALSLPIAWVDFTHRVSNPNPLGPVPPSDAALDSLSLLSQNVGRDQRAPQLDTILDGLNTNAPQSPIGNGSALLDFVAAFEK